MRWAWLLLLAAAEVRPPHRRHRGAHSHHNRQHHHHNSAAVTKAQAALEAERARQFVWQGRLAEAKAAVAEEAQHGGVEAKRALLASRVRIAKLRLHTKDLDERTEKEWAEARSLNATLRGLESERFAAHQDIAPALRALRGATAENPDETSAVRAEANATAMHEERVAAQEEVVALAEEERQLNSQVVATENRVWAMRSELAAAAADSTPILRNLTAAAAIEVVAAENATAPGVATQKREPPKPTAAPQPETNIPTAALAVAQLEQELVAARTQRAQVEAERQVHLASVQSMNATLAKLQERSRALSATLANVA